MSILPTQVWLNALIGLIRDGELALRWLWRTLGLAGDSHGQPAWPWAWRVATENLLIDLGLARQLAWSLAALLLAVAALGLALAWRRRRLPCVAVAAAALALAPWPPLYLALAPAAATSFHSSVTNFSVESIAVGAGVYARHCLACHGADGQGEGPQAAGLTRSPPTLVSSLLARRADGDIFGSIVDGMRDEHGGSTMPAFGGRLGDDEAWAVIDYMKALAAGSGARLAGRWLTPVALPGLRVRCGDSAQQTMEDWRAGQHVRVVALGAEQAGRVQALPLEDPRFQTLLLTPTGSLPPALAESLRANCVADTPLAWDAFASIAGTAPERLAGVELLADRAGWLRARGAPGQRAWSDADMLCTSEQVASAAASQDGLGELLARMDAEPVRFVKGGFIH